MGLPPCLQALHPGIPDETSATRSIIRSFHVMIISGGGEGGKIREEMITRITRWHYHLLYRDNRHNQLPVNHAWFKPTISISWLGWHYNLKDIRFSIFDISICNFSNSTNYWRDINDYTINCGSQFLLDLVKIHILRFISTPHWIQLILVLY